MKKFIFSLSVVFSLHVYAMDTQEDKLSLSTALSGYLEMDKARQAVLGQRLQLLEQEVNILKKEHEQLKKQLEEGLDDLEKSSKAFLCAVKNTLNKKSESNEQS